MLNVLNASFTGFVTAQGRSSENDPSGFVFRGGYVVGDGKTMLGRAYGPFSRVVFYGTYFGSVVDPQGWSAWDYSKQEYASFLLYNITPMLYLHN